MTVEMPNSMEECVYFTRRKTEDSKIIAWAKKIKCEKCGKGLMGKPLDAKTGRPKIRATEYVCQKCGNSESKEEHEKKLTVEIQYTCPHCGKDGEATTPYQRKTFEGVKSFIFVCGSCGKKIGITKKMKKPKKKK